MTDLLLAITHHLLVFSLTALLVVELVLLRQPMSAASVAFIARIDIFFGAAAGGVLAVGFLRVFLGEMPEAFYLESPYFWTKIAAFAAVGVLSIAPTIRFAGWGRRLRADPGFRPPAEEVRITRRFVTAEAGLFLLIPVFAAVMAQRGSF